MKEELYFIFIIFTTVYISSNRQGGDFSVASSSRITVSLLYQHEDAILDNAGARYEWITFMIRAAVVEPKVTPSE